MAFFSTNERSKGEGKGKEEEGKGERKSSMVEHQLRLLGSQVLLPAGAFAIFFPVSAKASLPISFSLSPFSFSFPFLFLSRSLCLQPFVCGNLTFLPIVLIF